MSKQQNSRLLAALLNVALLKDAQTKIADGKHLNWLPTWYSKDVEGVNDNGAGCWSELRQSWYMILKNSQQKMSSTKLKILRMNEPIGGDKELPLRLMKRTHSLTYLWRLKDAMFRTQSVPFRASVHGQLRIMFPMVALSSVAKAVFDEEKQTFC